jgi:hypothetical protein
VAEDASYLFQLAAACDLRWSMVTRFGTAMTPSAVLTAMQTATEAGYLVLDADRSAVGVLGFIDADAPSRVMWLDGHAAPGDERALALVRAAVPVVLDEAQRAGTVRFVYYDEYPELGCSLLDDDRDLWDAEVVIPRYVKIDGHWCTRITWRLTMTAWANRE